MLLVLDCCEDEVQVSLIQQSTSQYCLMNINLGTYNFLKNVIQLLQYNKAIIYQIEFTSSKLQVAVTRNILTIHPFS